MEEPWWWGISIATDWLHGGTMMMRYQYRNWLVTWGNHNDEVSRHQLTGYMGKPRWWGISTSIDWLHGETIMMRYQYINWLVTWGSYNDEVSVQQLTGYMGKPWWWGTSTATNCISWETMMMRYQNINWLVTWETMMMMMISTATDCDTVTGNNKVVKASHILVIRIKMAFKWVLRAEVWTYKTIFF